ncbi:hypothetical protein [Geodermatophilus sp. DSM 45219]|uniref:hypothetical protein n=1 Tax=Geodermatophilus sp. DSM 45219 TaxID=1881103 RepID=UPI0008823DFC|nr:hypothetical protein [Geodermatophilus sp. DSM 45219]SDN79229.1 hypothetical protein SAMN05428965_1646 [Geodermatophilus sp. DSM 45219]
MSEPITDTATTEQPQEGAGQEPKVFDAEYVEKLRKESAKYRTEAKANAEAATQVGELTQKLEKAESAAAEVPSKVAEALRTHLVELHGIESDDADLFLTANDPELLLKQVTRLVGRGSTKKSGNNVPREGSTTPAPKPDENKQFVGALFGRNPNS